MDAPSSGWARCRGRRISTSRNSGDRSTSSTRHRGDDRHSQPRSGSRRVQCLGRCRDGLHAYQRANGETIVFTENSGYDAKCNMFRIPPSDYLCRTDLARRGPGPILPARPSPSAPRPRARASATPPTAVHRRKPHGTIYSSAVNISATIRCRPSPMRAGMTDSAVTSCVYHHPVCRCRPSPRWPAYAIRADGDHQHHHQWGDHPLYHRRQHADRNRRHGLQQRR